MKHMLLISLLLTLLPSTGFARHMGEHKPPAHFELLFDCFIFQVAKNSSGQFEIIRPEHPASRGVTFYSDVVDQKVTSQGNIILLIKSYSSDDNPKGKRSLFNHLTIDVENDGRAVLSSFVTLDGDKLPKLLDPQFFRCNKI